MNAAALVNGMSMTPGMKNGRAATLLPTATAALLNTETHAPIMKNGFKGSENMGRAEMRRQKRADQKKQKVYTLTQAQIDKIKADATEEAVNQAMTLMLTIPLEVLITDYWPKTAYKRGQEFTEKVLALYHRWEAGEVSMDELKEDLWEYGGIRLEYKEVD